MLPLILLLTLAPAQKLPAGVLRYWSCDDDEGAAWRDNHWQAGGSPGTVYDTAEKVEGAASLRLTGPDKGELWVFSLARFVQVEQDGRFVLRFQARTRGVQNMAFVRILAHEPTAPDKYRPIGWVKLGEQRPEFTLPADSDWTRYEVPVGPLPGGTGRLFFYLGIAGPGTVWFDDFSLALPGVDVPLGGQVALADADYAGIRFEDGALPANLVQHGDFEADGVWQYTRSDSDARRIDDPTGRSQGVLRLKGVEFSSATAWQRIDIDPRRKYRLSYQARCEGLVGYGFAQVLRFNTHNQPFGWVGADHATEFCYVTGTTDGWERREQVFGVTPDTANIVLYVRVADTIGTVLIDDVTLTPLPLEDAR